LTVGNENFDFRVNVLWWDLDTNIPADRDRIGTLGFYEVHRYWDYSVDKEVINERNLATHPCTLDDAKVSGLDEGLGNLEFWVPLYQCLDLGESFNLFKGHSNVSTFDIRIDPCVGPDCY
jgi:hypothetical protein